MSTVKFLRPLSIYILDLLLNNGWITHSKACWLDTIIMIQLEIMVLNWLGLVKRVPIWILHTELKAQITGAFK